MFYVKIHIFFAVACIVCCCMLYVYIVCWNVYCAVMCGDADSDSWPAPPPPGAALNEEHQ